MPPRISARDAVDLLDFLRRVVPRGTAEADRLVELIKKIEERTTNA
jgi:hypothetical protein